MTCLRDCEQIVVTVEEPISINRVEIDPGTCTPPRNLIARAKKKLKEEVEKKSGGKCAGACECLVGKSTECVRIPRNKKIEIKSTDSGTPCTTKVFLTYTYVKTKIAGECIPKNENTVVPAALLNFRGPDGEKIDFEGVDLIGKKKLGKGN